MVEINNSWSDVAKLRIHYGHSGIPDVQSTLRDLPRSSSDVCVAGVVSVAAVNILNNILI